MQGQTPLTFGGWGDPTEYVPGEMWWAAEIFGITNGGTVNVYFVEEFFGP